MKIKHWTKMIGIVVIVVLFTSCTKTLDSNITRETIDVTLNQGGSVLMNVMQKLDSYRIYSNTVPFFNSISKDPDYLNHFVVPSQKNSFYLLDKYQNSETFIQVHYDSEDLLKERLEKLEQSASLKLEPTTLMKANIDLDKISEDKIHYWDLNHYDLPIYAISFESDFGSMEKIPGSNKKRELYQVKPGSLLIDTDWLQVLEEYPNYLPIYEKENGDMYFLEKLTQVNDDPEITSVSTYTLHLLSPDGETPIIGTNIVVLPVNLEKNFFSIDLPWIAYKHSNKENESSTSILNLETNQYLSLSINGYIDSLYSIKDGIIIASCSSIEDEDYKYGCRDYTFVDFVDKNVTKLIPPEKYVTLYASVGSQNILWLDSACSHVYAQIPGSKKEAILLSDKMKIKEIIPTVNASFWIIPFKPILETNSDIFLLKEENKHLKFTKCNLPIDLNKEKKEFFADQEGYLTIAPKKGNSNPSIYVISSQNPSLLTEYQFQLPEDIRELQLKTYLTSIHNTRFVVCYICEKITDDTEIFVGKNPESGEVIEIWVPYHRQNALFQYAFP